MERALDIAWMQYGKHLRGQQPTTLAGAGRARRNLSRVRRGRSSRGHKGLALARCCAIPLMLYILLLLPVRLAACERRQPPEGRGGLGGCPGVARVLRGAGYGRRH